MPQEGFFREANQVGDVHVVVLRGELDMAASDGLSDWLMEIAGSTVVADLSELTFLDSSGISALVIAKKQMRAQGDDLILTRPHPFVQRTLEVVGLGDWVREWDPKWDVG